MLFCSSASIPVMLSAWLKKSCILIKTVSYLPQYVSKSLLFAISNRENSVLESHSQS